MTNSIDTMDLTDFAVKALTGAVGYWATDALAANTRQYTGGLGAFAPWAAPVEGVVLAGVGAVGADHLPAKYGDYAAFFGLGAGINAALRTIGNVMSYLPGGAVASIPTTPAPASPGTAATQSYNPNFIAPSYQSRPFANILS